MNKQILETPHAVYNAKGIGLIDFRIEKMPIPADEKNKLARSFNTNRGIIGKMPGGQLLRFTIDNVKVLRDLPNDGTPVLPPDWSKYAQIIRDSKRRDEMKIKELKLRDIIRELVKEVMREK